MVRIKHFWQIVSLTESIFSAAAGTSENGDSFFLVPPTSERTLPLRLSSYWLRDHCRCADCFNPLTQTRKSTLFPIMPVQVSNYIVRKSRLEIDC